jgi:small-conductance mechanosensitive channel
MLERPIKIGDIIEVENVSGTVEWVGARSTRIKTGDNMRLVVPNSMLLQNKIINWSLVDDTVKRVITAGVVYGSPVRQVEKLLLQAADEHRLVERYPEPLVLFSDFGESALIFVLHIWISLARAGKAQISIGRVESDLRFRIDELFRQEGIVMAYPQRDLHIDSIKPIEVSLKRDDQS